MTSKLLNTFIKINDSDNNPFIYPPTNGVDGDDDGDDEDNLDDIDGDGDGDIDGDFDGDDDDDVDGDGENGGDWEWDQQQQKDNDDNLDDDENMCLHANIKKINGQNVCASCGEMFETLNKEAEWRFYGFEDNKHSSNPSRCHLGKPTGDSDKNILRELSRYDAFPDIVKATANSIYQQYIGKTHKEPKHNVRTGIIFGCIAQAYEYLGNPKNPDYLCIKMKITKKKIATSGKKEVEKYCIGHLNHKTAYELTIQEMIPDWLEILNFNEKIRLLNSINKTIDKMYWSLPTLKKSLECKNIKFDDATVTRGDAKYMLDYFFKHIEKSLRETADYKPREDDPIPSQDVFVRKESTLLQSSFKQSIVVGLLFYNLIKDGWVGIRYHMDAYYWFNIYNPYCVVNTKTMKGWLYICNEIAIWLPFETHKGKPPSLKRKQMSDMQPTSQKEIDINNINLLSVLSNFQFISKADFNQNFPTIPLLDITLKDNYGKISIITKKDFSEIVGYSEITIYKIAIELDRIAETNIILKK